MATRTRKDKQNLEDQSMTFPTLSTDSVLSPEELALVENFRKQKRAEEEKKAKELARKERAAKLESEFKSTMDKVRPQIEEILKKAEKELQKAVALAEEHGVPFSSYLEGMPTSRRYTPNSFGAKWGDVDRYVLYDYDIYDRDTGWEYWRSSSLSC